jgi:hypothetical protein
LFFEAAFGICLGCKVYNLFNQKQAQLCPGGVCEFVPARGAGGHPSQWAVVLIFALLIGAWMSWVRAHDPYDHTTPTPIKAEPAALAASSATLDPAEAERCKVPDFAKAMGHEEKWKLHNNCQ